MSCRRTWQDRRRSPRWKDLAEMLRRRAERKGTMTEAAAAVAGILSRGRYIGRRVVRFTARKVSVDCTRTTWGSCVMISEWILSRSEVSRKITRKR